MMRNEKIYNYCILDINNSKLAENTKKVYGKNIKRFNIYNNKKYAEIEKEDILSYLEHIKINNVKNIHINKNLQAIKKFFYYMEKRKIIKNNPCDSINLLREEKNKRPNNYLSKEEIEKIRDVYYYFDSEFENRDIAIFEFIISTGLPPRKIIGSLIEDIIIKNSEKYINLNIYDNNLRSLPMTKECYDSFKKYRKHLVPIENYNKQLFYTTITTSNKRRNPLTYDTLNVCIKRVLASIGIDGTCKTLIKTFNNITSANNYLIDNTKPSKITEISNVYLKFQDEEKKK